MSAVHARQVATAPAHSDSEHLFKEDRPRRIDRFISFFGDTQPDDADASGTFESYSGDRWSER
jgi:hypothetical protein